MTDFPHDFELDFHRKMEAFYSKMPFFLLVCYCVEEGMLLTAKMSVFSMEIKLKSIRKISQKLYNLYFMLEMYSLMLVSMESVCDRF